MGTCLRPPDFHRSQAAMHVASGIVLLTLMSGCSRKQPSGEHQAPPPLLSRKAYETARLFNGITVKSSVEGRPSDFTALPLENDPDSYVLHLELHLEVPKPASTLPEVLAATPDLEDVLPDLEGLLQNGAPSPDFNTLFAYKEKNLQANLNELQRLLPRETLYDCQTILNLQNPGTSRQAVLIQALMDVNTDGSDGDRNLPVEKPALFFQPQTNYRWPKASKHPNPYLHEEARQVNAIEEKLLDDDSLGDAERTHLKAELAEKKSTLVEMKRWSFLVGSADPFIVLPEFMFETGPGHPQIGDYAIVIAKGMLYPAIVGDKGPRFKMGEASLRICREIDPKSTADSRPVDHPKVTYLLFPGSAEKPFGTPDYQHWSDRCHALWKEFGGSDSAPWKEWKSLENPWPTPTPVPTPEPTPTTTPASSPEESPSPSPSTSASSASSPLPTPSATGAESRYPVPSATPVPSPVTPPSPTPDSGTSSATFTLADTGSGTNTAASTATMSPSPETTKNSQKGIPQ